ncbi:MAG: right-handed parallel beta-helix repeat-containing protein [Candidatus Hydrogenedentes bacterium]|nr:right-handed parallel beta-helix repeat-containing protein [Candidatus Hydrogenedentota bacterium]
MKRISKISIFAVIVCTVIFPTQNNLFAQLVIHVSPDGANGAHTTLEAARDALRAARAGGGLAEGAEVRIHGGDYILEKPFLLEEQDSGTADAPIRYIAGTEVTARLLGGRLVTGFAPVTNETVLSRIDESARPHVVQLNLKEQGITEFETPLKRRPELFFDGMRMTLARWPNKDFSAIVDIAVEDGHVSHGRVGSKTGKFFYEGDRPSRWLDEPDPWVHGYWFWDWSEQRHPIESINVEKKIIAVKEPYHVYGYRKAQWYYAYNLLSELDTPGEWYLDRESGVLYFWPPSDPATTEVMVTQLPNLITMKKASYITLQGLTLEGARGVVVAVQGGEGNRINSLTVRNSGKSAISVSDGKNNGVEGCDIYGMGGAGISISGGNRTTLEPAGHFAVNNHIHDFAQVKRVYQAGIQVGGVGNRVANNYIHDAPHMAIGFGGNDHIIELNEIHDVCLESNDAGAMYTGRNWTMRGHVIRYNYLYDINGFHNEHSVGIYLDDMFSSAEIYGNVFRNVYRAAFIGGGRDCTVENNIFINCRKALHIDGRALNWAHQHADDWIAEEKEKGTISGIAYNKPPYSERYPKLTNILESEPKAPIGNLVARNIFVGKDWKDVYEEADSYIKYKDNLTDTDPLFVDMEKHDYRLKPESPALKMGFEPLPLEKMGLFKSELRASWPVK